MRTRTHARMHTHTHTQLQGRKDCRKVPSRGNGLRHLTLQGAPSGHPVPRPLTPRNQAASHCSHCVAQKPGSEAELSTSDTSPRGLSEQGLRGLGEATLLPRQGVSRAQAGLEAKARVPTSLLCFWHRLSAMGRASCHSCQLQASPRLCFCPLHSSLSSPT